jgi:hypothetical protein
MIDKQFIAVVLLASALSMIPLIVLISHSHDATGVVVHQTQYYDPPVISDCRGTVERPLDVTMPAAPQGFQGGFRSSNGVTSAGLSTIPAGGLSLPGN